MRTLRTLASSTVIVLLLLSPAFMAESSSPATPLPSTLSYQGNTGQTVTVEVIEVFHWPCEGIRDDYNLGAVLNESSEPSKSYPGGTSYVITYEGGECHYIRDKDGNIVHGPHVRLPKDPGPITTSGADGTTTLASASW